MLDRLRSSFQGRLALRIGGSVFVLALMAAAAGYLSLRSLLYHQLEDTLLRLADIEASAAAHDSTVHFHDAVFISEGAGHEAVLPRYGQFWTLDGRPILRTANLKGQSLPLPRSVRRTVRESRRWEMFSGEFRGDEIRSVVYPIEKSQTGRGAYLLQVAASAEPTQSVLSDLRWGFSGGVVLMTLVGFGVGRWIAGRSVRPIRSVIRQAERIEVSGERDGIEVEADTWEVRRLVDVLNSMLERIEEAFESQRRFLADAGHEIKTPLTVLRGDISVALRRDRAAEEYRKVLGRCLEDVTDVTNLADDLITLARSESGRLPVKVGGVDGRRLVENVADRYRERAGQQGLQILVDAAGDASFEGNPDLLERAVEALVDNAVKYAGSGTTVRLTAEGRDGAIVLAVRDDGPGIPEGEREEVTQRFRRGEGARQLARGTGLGLSIASAAAKSHGGRLELESEEGRGTEVRILIPVPPGEGHGGSV